MKGLTLVSINKNFDQFQKTYVIIHKMCNVNNSSIYKVINNVHTYV